MTPDVLISCVVSGSRDKHNRRERSCPVRQAQRTGELVMSGEIIEADFPLHVRRWSGTNCVFLRTLANGRGHVFGGSAFQNQRINLLKGQRALPSLLFVVPDAVVIQVELVHSKMQTCTVARDLIENSLVAAGVDQLSFRSGCEP